MVQVLYICLAKNTYIINVDIYTDSQLVFEQVVHDVLEGGRSIAVALLHDSSPVGAIWYRKYSIHLIGGVNPDTIVAITDVNFRLEGVYSNYVSDEALTGDQCRL